MRLCGKRAKLRGLAGQWAQWDQPDDTCVHDCRWPRPVTDRFSEIAAIVSDTCIAVIAPHFLHGTAECSRVQDTV